jgi:hypothetical protein
VQVELSQEPARPRRVEVDCYLNASARFNRGLSSFLSHDLILKLGMPLVAGVTERKLAGVIAYNKSPPLGSSKETGRQT